VPLQLSTKTLGGESLSIVPAVLGLDLMALPLELLDCTDQRGDALLPIEQAGGFVRLIKRSNALENSSPSVRHYGRATGLGFERCNPEIFFRREHKGESSPQVIAQNLEGLVAKESNIR
jgi:hypothetical protein